MPDISMCINSDCPLRSKCYRYRVKPSDWQSFARFTPHTVAKLSYPTIYETNCDYFWDIEGYYEKELLPTETVDNKYKG